MTAPALTQRQHRRDLARAAINLLRVRERFHAPAIEAGELSEKAEKSLHLARCLVAQWRWVLDPARPPCPEFDEKTDRFGAYNFELAADIAGAAARQRSIAAKQPNNAEAAMLAELYEALAWLQQPIAGAALIVHDVDLERPALPANAARAA
jgi:hypothetical protein